jgi:hypothetical protein
MGSVLEITYWRNVNVKEQSFSKDLIVSADPVQNESITIT